MPQEVNRSHAGENKMGYMPMNRLLISMALPMMISMLVQSLYNIVDSIFVSRICEEALTAVSMAFPIQNLMIGVGSGLGVGMNALISRALGERKPEEAGRIAMQGIFLEFLGYLLFLVVGLTFARPFFVVQGAGDLIADFGHDYLFVVTVLGFGLFGQMTMERMLQATGLTIYSMITQGTGAILNIILDPVLIFGLCGLPKMGIAGAALATVIGQVVAGLIGLYLNLTRNKEITLTFRGFAPNGDRIARILGIAVPSVIMVAIGSVMTFSINKILVIFSSTAVAVFGVYYKLQSFAFMPVFGLNNGMVPIVSFNYGAKKIDRMLACRKYAIFYAEGIMLAALAVVQLFPVQLLGMFSASEDMLAMGIPALRTITISFLFAGFCVISGSFFQALGFSIYSTMVSFIRQLIFLVPLAFLFSRTGNLHMVWWAWPIAELSSVAVSLFLHGKVLQHLGISAKKSTPASDPD